MLAVFLIGSLLLAFQQFLEDMVNNKLGPSLRHNMKFFGVGSMVANVDHHFRTAITRETVILHAVYPRAGKLIERSGALRVFFLKFPGYLLDSQVNLLALVRS